MSFYRLIKPDWAKPKLANGEANPKFVREFQGPDVREGAGFTPEYLREMNQLGYNIYFFPNHPSKDVYAEGAIWLAGRMIDTFNYVFVDMDLKDGIYKTKEEFLDVVSRFPLKPTMVVNSGNGIHVYWQMKDLTRDAFVITNLALINHFKTDESVFTVLQLMRLPGYFNTKKHDNFVPAEILKDFSSEKVYSISDMPQEIYNMPQEAVLRGQRHLDKLDGKLTMDLPALDTIDELPDRFLEWIKDPKNKPAYSMFYTPAEGGRDRSSADMSLANVLFKAQFNRKEALAVISNTQKALSKGANRFSYAESTVNKVYLEKFSTKFRTVGELLTSPTAMKNLGQAMRGTWYFDTSVLGYPWRKKEVMGLIAGPGVGKTTVVLKWIKDCIENNPDNDDIHVFFSLEMPAAAIAERWRRLVGDNSPLSNRLYVVGNEDEGGNPRNIGLQEIHEDCEELKKCTGKALGMIAIDHIGILSKHIDTRKKHTFGILSETEGGWGEVRPLSLNSLATQTKVLAKMLDAFVIVLTQTTKEKGVGDRPIDKDGAYGISQYENIMDRIITIWQPLMRVQNQTKTRFLAWQYVKIREKHKEDKIQTHEPKLLTFDLDTGDLKITTQDEYAEFTRLLPAAIQIQEDLSKKKMGSGYSIHVNLDKVAEAVKNLNNSGGQVNAVGQVQPNQHTGTNHSS